MNIVHVKGKNKGEILLYSLSTCIWCKKVKSFLSKLGVEYSYIFVDLLNKKEKDKIDIEINKWNPKRNFPMIVINNKKCIVGYREDEIRSELKI